MRERREQRPARLVSVIVCTHNPRMDALRRTLKSISLQDLDPDSWELLIIDNGSTVALSNALLTGQRCAASITREEKLGLTNARVRAFRETRTPFVIFCDDDNVIEPDYVRTALEIFGAFPQLGAIGASVVCEYEEPVEAPREFIDLFSDPTGGVGGVWSNDIRHDRSNPIGAGLCLRREVAERFLERVANDSKLLMLGRSGTQLLSYEDTEIVRTACSIGFGKGIFSELKLTHLIGSSRTTEDYILRLHEGHAFSKEIFQFVGGAAPTKFSSLARIKCLLEVLRASGLQRRIVQARQRGRARGLQHIEELLSSKSDASPPR